MANDNLLASPFQEAAFGQAVWNGFTYARAVSFECRVSHAAANGVLGALVYKKILMPFPLYGNVSGFRPTRFACTAFDKPPSLAKPIGEQAPVFRLARLADATRRNVRPYEPDELVRCYPDLADFTDLASRFLPGVSVELTALYVDHGASADRVRGRINHLAARYLRHEAAQRLVWAGRLGVRVLTATVPKAEAIAKRLNRADDAPLCRAEIDVVDDLEHLLPERMK
jgi:hypothetical protein